MSGTMLARLQFAMVRRLGGVAEWFCCSSARLLSFSPLSIEGVKLALVLALSRERN